MEAKVINQEKQEKKQEEEIDKEKEKEKEKEKKEEKIEKDKKGKHKKEGKDEDKKKKKEEKKNEIKEIFLYFIEAHSDNYTLKIELSDDKHDNKYAKELTKIKEIFLDTKEINTINKLKISPPPGTKSLKLRFKLIDTEKNINFKAEIELKEFSHDVFFYDFDYTPEKAHKNEIKEPNPVLTHPQQFKIYLNYIQENDEMEKKSPEITNLVLSTESLLIIKKKKKDKDKGKEKVNEFYDLCLYLLVFTASYENPVIINLLNKFDLKYINYDNFKNTLEGEDVENISIIIDKMEDDPESILKNVENEEDKKKCKAHLLFIIYCHRLFYEINKIQSSINNILKNEDVENDIYKGIIKYTELFGEIHLEKEQISKMVSLSSSFSRIKRSLGFADNTYDYFKIIFENFEHIVEIRNNDLKDKEKGKKTEEFVLEINKDKPKYNDNIEQICNIYKKIFDKQNEKGIEKLVIFSPKLFEIYIQFYKDNNLNNLVYLKNMIKAINKIIHDKEKLANKQKQKKEIEKKKEEDIYSKYKKIKTNLEQLIHQTGLVLSSRGILSNMEILNFIKEDKDFIKNLKDKEIKNSLISLTGIDIHLIDDEFIKEWKTIDWQSIFGIYEKYIYKKFSEYIFDFKGFDILMKILNISKNENEFKFSSESLIMMQEKFIQLIQRQNILEENNYKNSLIELIYHSDLHKNAYASTFLRDLENIMSFDMFKNIYNELCSKYQEKLTEETKRLIISYFLNNTEDKAHEALFEFSQNFESLRQYIFKEISIYELQKKDFWVIEENEKIQLFKGLLEKADITNDKYKSIDYVNNSINVINELQEDLDNNSVLYQNINKFFESGKLDELTKRLAIIYYNDKDKADKKLDELLNLIEKINNTLDNLNLINKDLNDFLYISEKDSIDKIFTFISGIIKGSMKYFEENYAGCNNLIQRFKEDAEKRRKIKESKFFWAIYVEMKNEKTLNDVQWVKNAEEQFNELKNFFSSEGLGSVKKEILTICLNLIKNESHNDIVKEIDILIKIFEVQTDSSLFDKEDIVKKLELLSRSEDIKQAAKSISTFIKLIGARETTFKESIDALIKKSDQEFDENAIQEGGQLLLSSNVDINISYEKDYEKKHKNNYLKVLKMLTEHPDSINFLVKRNKDDCATLRQLVGENDSPFLTVNHIIDLEKCVYFMNSIGTEQSLRDMTDIDLIKKFVETTQKSTEELGVRFTSYSNNFIEIKKLFDSRLDKTEATRQKIDFILQNSEFILKSEKNGFFKGSYFEKFDKQLKEIDFKNIDELLELRDRAQLLKKTNFIKIISEIYNFFMQLIKLINSGYPDTDIITIKISLNQYKLSYKYNSEESEKTYQDISADLKNKLKSLRETQKNAYEQKEYIRFIYGRQFNLINSMNKDKIKPLLMFFTRNLMTETIESYHFNDNKNIEGIIDGCQHYLEEILKKNKLSLNQIYKDSLISTRDKYKGLYINYIIKSEDLEKELFLIYKYLTKNFPISQNILLCTKDTSSEELTAFLYRAILCKFNACFIMGGIESLEYEKKAKILDLLTNLLEGKNKKMESCLIIFYTNKNNDIYKNLNLLRFKQDLEIKSSSYSQIKIGKEESNVEIIASDYSGAGKSTQIKLEIEEIKQKKYIYFPFGGVINRDDIVKRLKDLDLSEPKKIALHLDLYDTDETELMTEFLFSILITKIYGHDENLFYFPKEIEIIIEIPNGFVDLIKKFPILTFFDKRTLLLRELPPLIVPKDLKSNVQIVANFLKLRKERDGIDNFDLYFEGLTPTAFYGYNTRREAQILSQEECQKLIFQEIRNSIEHPNYYQIKSFIDVLATQFKEFNRNFYINSYLLREHRIDRSLRSSIINSYIKMTKHFTKGAFSELIRTQEETRNYLMQYNAEEEIDSGIKKLSKIQPNLVSFDKFNYSLIFFHEGEGQGFSIISNLPGILGINNNEGGNDKNLVARSEYKKLYDLYNFQEREEAKKRDLPNYKIFSQKDFLKELQQILDLKTDEQMEKQNKEIKENINKENEEIRKKNEEIKKRKEEHKENKEEYEKLKDYEDYRKKSLEEIAGKYVLTADNFIKMILILLRIRSNIPVIMMGETGCGKTSLIRMLSRLLNEGSDKKMKVLNIHAGTSDNDIINFIKTKILKKAEKYQKEDEEEAKIRASRGNIFIPRKIWVFLDEINTCKSMGLISELMCKHTYQGHPLPSNVVFIAACNPYRCYEKGKKVTIGLDINQAYKEKKHLNEKDLERLKRNSNSDLVYTVNPLPHSLLNYVFDFGNLEPNDEKKYIESIVEEPIKRIGGKNLNENQIKDIHKLATGMILKAQNFTREKNEISSVSLREIRRFNIFYEFFFEYLRQRKENTDELMNSEEDNFYKECGYLTLHRYSIILGVFMCYYLRIVDNDTRKQFNEIMNKEMASLDPFLANKDFLEIPNREELYVLKNMEIEKGIAQNRALLDNTFSLFVAINNKIPIFIVGKPGCSKSLSVQLINKSMKGSSSKKPLFRKFPILILSSYQGSMASTSDGVKKVFEQVKKNYKNLSEENKKYNISMIFFDEMGLAEHSPNNPLKVIHAELDEALDEGNSKIAFVGISNWTLDASKMNRGMHLSIPEPSKEDTQKTALTIGESYDITLASKYKDFYEGLGLAYYKYKQYLKNNHKRDRKEDFHGNRDFYHLIKYSAREIIKKDNQNKEGNKEIETNIGKLGLERNFGGLKFISEHSNKVTTSIKIIKDFYTKKKCENNYEVLERIKENIVDIKSRYLLVISKSSASIFLLSALLSEKPVSDKQKIDNITELSPSKKEYNLYVGSPFNKDHHSEEYSLKILNKIQLHMEEGKVLILKNLESVYPALYDLFNQNFTEVGKKKYARIAIGSSTNTFSFVNENFRCIVSVNYEQIEQEEAPFLNRFEKHIVSLDYLLSENLRKESLNIFKKLNEMIILEKEKYKGINYDLKRLFINLDLEEIQGIMYKASLNGVKEDKMIDEVIKKVSLTLPQDIILCLKLNGYQTKYPEEFKKIIDGYNKGEHHNLRRFLEKMTEKKNIVYTFTNNLEKINNLKEINTPIFGIIQNDNIKEIKISSFKSENEFEQELDKFLEEKKYKICLIKFNSNEGIFINYVQFFIENKLNSYLEEKKEDFKEKAFVFIVNMMRVYDTELKDYKNKSRKERIMVNKKILKETISYLSEYYQVFIDNLNGLDNIQLDSIFKSEGLDIYENFLNFADELKNNIYPTLSYMKLNIPFSFGEINEENYKDKLINYLSRDEDIKKKFNECLRKQIGQKDDNKDLIKEMFKINGKIKANDKDLVWIIHEDLCNEYIDYLAQFYFEAEKDNFFATILSMEEEKKINNETISEDLKNIYEIIKQRYLSELKINKKNKIIKRQGQNLINIYLGLKIPKIITSLKKMINFIKDEIEKNYMKNENNLRKEGRREELSYKKKLKNFNEALALKLSEMELLKQLNPESDKNRESELLNLLLEDYFTFFIFENVKNIKEKKYNETSKKNVGMNEVKKFLKYLIELKKIGNTEIDLFKKNASIINWIQCYKEDLSTILQMFSSLSLIVDNLTEKIKSKIKDEQMKSSNTESASSIVNDALFYGMESILKILTSDKDIYISMKKNSDDFYELMNITREILQNAFKVEKKLNLSIKEAYTLKQIIEIIDTFQKNQKDTDENITSIINSFLEEKKLFEKEYLDVKDLLDNFKNLYNNIEKSLGNNKSFPKLMSKIIHDEYLKIQNERFRKKLLNIIISKNELIYNCYPLLKKIVKGINISIEPNNIDNNLKIFKETNDPLIEILAEKNSDNSEFLEQAIFQIFERLVLKYFDNIDNLDKNKDKKTADLFEKYISEKIKGKSNYKKYMIFGKSFDIFEQFLGNIKSLYLMSNGENNKISHLDKLYSLSFIKVYITKFIEYIDKYDDNEIFYIYKAIKDDTTFTKILKIYILKILFNFNNRNYEQFIKSNFIDKLELGDLFKDSKESFLINYFLPMEEKNENEFKDINERIKLVIENHVNSDSQSSSSSEEINNIDIFLIVSINLVLSNLLLKDYLNPTVKSYEQYKLLCEYFKKNYKSSDSELKKLLFLFYDIEKFKNIIKPKFEQLYKDKLFIGEPYESLLYGYRFCVQSLLKKYNSNEKLLYSSILSNESLSILNSNYIPGNNTQKSKKLESFTYLKIALENSSPDTGYYVCSCGYLYSIGPCGFPTKEHSSKCPECQKDIGYAEKKIKELGAENHGMVIREGHYRIFKNAQHKKEQMSKYGDPDENIPNRTLDEYKKEVIDPILNSTSKGILKITKEDFLNKNKTIGKMSTISYRLLNFILLNHIFYANCIGNISDDALKEDFIIKDMNCLEIIQVNWNLLEEALREKNISSIQAFMNIIFKELSELISNCKMIENENDLNTFLKEVEKTVESNIEQYPSNYDKYLKMSKKYNLINEKDIKMIINESFPPTEDIYPHAEYPFLKYFMYTKYNSNFESALEKEEDFSEKYPLLKSYLYGPKEYKMMEYLPDFNKFTNSMVEKYSYHITREEAKKIKLKDTEGFNETNLNNFKKSWDKIYKYATKYKCRDEMVPKKLSSDDELIYFLNDDNELGNGMYISAACQNFITWQNEFLQPIIHSAKFNGNLHYYLENMKKKIPLQEANINQILSITDCFKNSDYKDFDDLVYHFTKRDIYDKDKINYQNYNKFIFDFPMIEEELGKLILPEKCLFDNEDKLNFVIYLGEGFRGGQSDMFAKFYAKYPQVYLDEDERKAIYSSIQNLYNNNNNDNITFKTLFSSMSLLLYYLVNNIFIPDKEIRAVLDEKPEYLKIDEKCIEFLSDNNLKINQFMNMFFFAEHLYFKELIKTLQDEYKKPIDEPIISEIKNQLENKKENDIIPWKELAAATRRFISRYLVGDRQTTDISEKTELVFQLSRTDLWEEKLGKLNNLDDLITQKINQFKLKVGQAYSFYELIGEEDKKSITIFEKKEEEKVEVNNNGGSGVGFIQGPDSDNEQLDDEDHNTEQQNEDYQNTILQDNNDDDDDEEEKEVNLDD